MQDLNGESLLMNLSNEYQKATEYKRNSNISCLDKKLRTIRIFISSTFRDFHNERNLLVTKIFPRLREWCAKHGLYLVECDLRWGIPAYVSHEETLITCLEEIERGRYECNNMNFFLGLIGDRYGWIPENKDVTEYIRKKYNWIDDSSVTLMEFIHGMIRTLTPNGLIMIRSPGFIELLPDHNKLDFVEHDPTNYKLLNLFKNFLINKFANQGFVRFYEPDFEGITFDKFIEQNRVLLKGLELFGEIVENYFKECIKNNLLKFIDDDREKINNEDFHALMLRGCGKQCTIRHKTFRELFSYLESFQKNSSGIFNSIVILSGIAGIGKSTILACCVKELEKVMNNKVFFHSVSCTTSSQRNEEIIERLYRFLNGKQMKGEDNNGKRKKLNEIFLNGVEFPDKKVYYIVLDGLDELCQGSNLEWVPMKTHSSIVLVLSTLLDTDCISFYTKLKDPRRNIKEILIEPMTKEELSYVVSKYLENFGKRLDPSQMDALMEFQSSKNPLWLISACEELRIHGDYQSVMKFILSLPSNIIDLNRTIIKRLINQDSSNLLQCFLKILIISRAGIWESVVRELLSVIMGYKESVNQRDYSDIVRQMKGFLLIESIPMPLIKFRHRVTKQSIEMELELDDKSRLELHRKMADFFQPSGDTFNNLFLSDYVYHLIKSNSRNRLIKFMRSKRSWTLFNQTLSRSRILMSMRCNNFVYKTSETFSNNLVLCIVCKNQSGQLSIYSTNKTCCYFCGKIVINSEKENRLSACFHHKLINPNMKICVLCEMPIFSIEYEYVKICQFCKNFTFPNQCGVIVNEADILLNQQTHVFLDSKIEYLT